LTHDFSFLRKPRVTRLLRSLFRHNLQRGQLFQVVIRNHFRPRALGLVFHRRRPLVPRHLFRDLPAQVQAHLEFLDDLLEAYGPETSVLLVGHSIGAWFIQEMLKARAAALHPRPRVGAFMLFPVISTLGPLALHSVSLHDESGQKKNIIDYVNSVVYSDTETMMKRWREEDKKMVAESLSEEADGM
jgi:pimeloyl-ACP methyl ester carboxylesterase